MRRRSQLRLALPMLCAALVAACSSDGSSEPADVPRGLAAPTDVFANPAPEGAYVGWQPSTEPDLASYQVSASAAGGANSTQTVDASASGVELAGLRAGLTYSITVTAVDHSGLSSPASAAASVRVPRANTPVETLQFDYAALYSANHGGDAVVVLRDGQVVYEAYQNGFVGADAHPLASGTKSFSCALLLAAAGDGLIGPETLMADVLTEWRTDPNKSRMTVRQLLSLQGGLSTNPEYAPEEVARLDTYQLALEDPAAFAPGSAFIYDPLAFQAFALAFERRAGNRDPVEYLRERVFAPIGLTGDIWQRDAEDNPQMAAGAQMTALMWARYGQLMLQNGTWQTRRVLPAAGVRDCLSYRNEAYLGYGITWWLNRPVEDSYDPSVDQVPEDGVAGPRGQIAPSQAADMVMAAGAGRQRLYLLPSEGLVIVRFGALASEAGEWSDDEFLRRISPL